MDLRRCSRRSRQADRADGGRRRHPGRRAARGLAVDVAELRRVPRSSRCTATTTSTVPRRSRTARCRLNVMGERGANREPPPPPRSPRWVAWLARQSKPERLGFTTSRTLQPSHQHGRTDTDAHGVTRRAGRHRRRDRAGPARRAAGRERLPRVRQRVGRRSRAMVEASGRPLTVSLAATGVRTARQRRSGLPAQPSRAGTGESGRARDSGAGCGAGDRGAARSAGDIEPTSMRCPSYRELVELSHSPTRVARLAQPELRAALHRRRGRSSGRCKIRGGSSHVFELGDPADYEPDTADLGAARAARCGVTAEESRLDLLLERRRYEPALRPHPELWRRQPRCRARDAVAPLCTVPGLADGGAHVGTICDGSFPTTLLAHWGTRPVSRRAPSPSNTSSRRQCRGTARRAWA